MKNKKLNLLASIITGVGLMGGLNANAADDNWYAGVSYGTTSVDSGVSNTTGTARLDEEDSGYKITLGKKIHKSISIEGFYADFGESSLTGNTGDNFDIGGTTYQFIVNNANLTQSITGLGVNAKFNYAFNDKSSIAGRVGMLMWDATVTVSGASITSSSASADGTDLFYGIGYQYDFNKQLSLTVDYDMYAADELDFDMVAIGVLVNF